MCRTSLLVKLINRFSSCQLRIFQSSVLFCQTFFYHKFAALYLMLCRPVASSKKPRNFAVCISIFRLNGYDLFCFFRNAKTKVVHLIFGFSFVLLLINVIFKAFGFSYQLTIFVFQCLKKHSSSWS